MGALSSYLTELLQNGTRRLSGVSERRMFGSNAFFRDGKIFALEWDDRLAVKLREQADYDALLSEAGAEPWSPMKAKPMSSWVLLPEGYHDDEEGLAVWLGRAHAQAEEAEAPKQRGGARNASVKKTGAGKSASAKRAGSRAGEGKSPSAKRAGSRAGVGKSAKTDSRAGVGKSAKADSRAGAGKSASAKKAGVGKSASAKNADSRAGAGTSASAKKAGAGRSAPARKAGSRAGGRPR